MPIGGGGQESAAAVAGTDILRQDFIKHRDDMALNRAIDKSADIKDRDQREDEIKAARRRREQQDAEDRGGLDIDV